MKTLRFLVCCLVLGALVLGAAGCSKFTLDARALGDPVCMTRGKTEAPSTVRFTATTKAAYVGLLFNLVNWTHPDIEGVLRREIQAHNGVGVQNLTIRKEVSFVDGLISVVSFGIYNPETITIEGEVVK